MKKTSKMLLLLSIVLVLLTGCSRVNKSAESALLESELPTEHPPQSKIEVESVPAATSDIITLEGVEYTFPCRVSELIQNGWENSTPFSYRPRPNDGQGYISHMNFDGSKRIASLNYSSDSENTPVYDCEITELRLVADDHEGYKPCSFVLPGNITQNSVYSDVVDAFGDAANNRTNEYFHITDDFDPDSEDPEFRYYVFYGQHKNIPYLYQFIFYQDGKMKQVEIKCNI